MRRGGCKRQAGTKCDCACHGWSPVSWTLCHATPCHAMPCKLVPVSVLRVVQEACLPLHCYGQLRKEVVVLAQLLQVGLRHTLQPLQNVQGHRAQPIYAHLQYRRHWLEQRSHQNWQYWQNMVAAGMLGLMLQEQYCKLRMH